MWVAELLISDRTAAKIIGLHNIHPDEVREAVVAVAGLQWARDIDELRGPRVLVQAEIRGKSVLLVLYDADHPLGDAWHLGSAFFVDLG
jgi:hypothetical protein